MLSFYIDDKELWIVALQKAGVCVVREDDGSRWIEVDAFFDFLTRARNALRNND